MEHIAEVRLWGDRVGALAFDPGTGVSTFEFAAAWIARGTEIAPIHMPLASTLYQFPGLARETWCGLPPLFADTLPDDFGNAVIDAWLARQGRDPASFTPVERLLYTGTRGMGAIEYEPADSRESEPDGALELAALVGMAQRVLDARARLAAHLDHGSGNEDAMRSILTVGTSAGGARAKAVVAVDAARSEIRPGQVDAPPGFEHWLLKLDGVEEHRTTSETFGDAQGFGRMEYAYSLMAHDAGISMSPCELLVEGERAHFMTKRFDRDGNHKLHYISLCAIDHADYKQPGAYAYEQLLGVARKLHLRRDEAIEIYRRMVFNVVARNHDDHTKNTGFLRRSADAPWQLAPAFDIAYSYKPGSAWVNDHQMTLNGKRDDFTRDDLLAVSEQIGRFQREAPAVIDRVVEVVREWRSYAARAGVFGALTDEVQANLRLEL